MGIKGVNEVGWGLSMGFKGMGDKGCIGGGNEMLREHDI